MRIWLRFVLRLLAVVVVVLLAVVVWLTLPGTPSSGASVRFNSAILLPRGGVLNVLDYLNVEGGDLYAASISSGSVWKIPLDGRPIATLPGRPVAHGVVLDPVSHMAFASRSGVDTVEIFDPATMSSVATLPVSKDADGIFYDAKNRLVFVDGGDASEGTVIDPATRAVVGTIALGGKPEFASFDSQTGWMLQNLESTDELLALDLATRTVVRRTKARGLQGTFGHGDRCGRAPCLYRLLGQCAGGDCRYRRR